MTRSSPTSVPSMSRATAGSGRPARGRRGRRPSGGARPSAVAAFDAEDRGRPGEVRLDRRLPARQRPRRPPPASLALVGADLEQGDAVRRRARSGRRSRSARMTSSPSGAAVERQPRLEGAPRSAARRSRRSGRTAGWRGRRRAGAVSGRTGGSRSASTNRIPSAAPWPTAFSRARSSASGETSVARIVTLRPIVTPRRRSATAAPPRSPRCRSRRRRPGPGRRRGRARAGLAAARPAGITSASAASTSASVSGRGISARASTAKASPWNSLIPRM